MYRWWNLINMSSQGFGHHHFPSLLPSLIPHMARRDLLWHLISSLHKSFNGFLLHVNIHSLVLTPSATDGSPTLTPFIFAQVTRFLSVLLSATLFPTSGFCTCYFSMPRMCFLLLFTSLSFCHPSDLDPNATSSSQPVLTILFKVGFPFLLFIFVPHFLHNTCHNLWLYYLFLWLFVYNTTNSVSSGSVSVLFPLFFQSPAQCLAEFRFCIVWMNHQLW